MKKGIPSRVPVIRPLESDHLEFEPLSDYVLLERVELQATRAGLVLTEGAQRNLMSYWKVLAVGPGRAAPTTGHVTPVRVQVGDGVWVTAEMGQAFDIPGRSPTQLIVSETAIIAIVRERPGALIESGETLQ